MPTVIAEDGARTGFGLMIDHVDGGTVTVSGELDVASVGAAIRCLHEAWQGSAAVVLDLRKVSFIDCVGLHAVIAADARHRDAGGRLVILSGSPQTERLFRLIRAADRLEVVADGNGRATAASTSAVALPLRADEELRSLRSVAKHVAGGSRRVGT